MQNTNVSFSNSMAMYLLKLRIQESGLFTDSVFITICAGAAMVWLLV